ncbi:flagellar basal body rod protein [Pontibacillus sp. HMF3514]|uniref:lmo0954 family membrane protein n=1 Tax=Pontibacillus sp. HMF3514 TaxID=2692425 RepID=UPI00131F7791|nr:flagellar basal body rod protein [Pontibacillus sp. HMF3514]QHE52642.1 flagellar basal body rod protein [Pontibacillus sp. HMF3514]
MKQFLWFVAGLVALAVLVANLGPMIMLAAGVWLLYVIFKQFIKTDSTAKKILWVILGFVVLSFTVSNIYAVVGVAAAYVLYIIYKKWKRNDRYGSEEKEDDPFVNFEKQWAELNKS